MHIQLTERYPTREGRRVKAFHVDVIAWVMEPRDGGGGSTIGLMTGDTLELHEDYDEVCASLRAVGSL